MMNYEWPLKKIYNPIITMIKASHTLRTSLVVTGRSARLVCFACDGFFPIREISTAMTNNKTKMQNDNNR